MQALWQAEGTYRFDLADERPVYSIDTPPPTVSGHLHLGHVYSYSHADFIARFFRMNGLNVFYPMGFDDNGLPTERLVEKRQGVTAAPDRPPGLHPSSACRSARKPKRITRPSGSAWGFRSIGAIPTAPSTHDSQRISQLSFLRAVPQGAGLPPIGPGHLVPGVPHLHRPGRPERPGARQRVCHPAVWPAGWADVLPIATTRPELLAACVAVFVHPGRRALPGLHGPDGPRAALRPGRAHPGRPGGRPAEGHRRGDVLHLWRPDRRGLVVHPPPAAGRSHRPRRAHDRRGRANSGGLPLDAGAPRDQGTAGRAEA